jgi:DNA-binding NarL/FixJ family response regulator
MTIRILIADDHAVVAEGLRALINAQANMAVVGLAANGRDAVRQTIENRPNVVVLDYAMPELNGIEAARTIRKRFVNTRVLMLSMHSTSVHVHRALQAGVDGYVMKESVGRELADGLLEHLISDIPQDPLELLSSRERQVLQLIAEGSSVVKIAVKLSLSRKTVETYRQRMMDKLRLSDFAALVKFAIQHDVISLD